MGYYINMSQNQKLHDVLNLPKIQIFRLGLTSRVKRTSTCQIRTIPSYLTQYTTKEEEYVRRLIYPCQVIRSLWINIRGNSSVSGWIGNEENLPQSLSIHCLSIMLFRVSMGIVVSHSLSQPFPGSDWDGPEIGNLLLGGLFFLSGNWKWTWQWKLR